MQVLFHAILPLYGVVVMTIMLDIKWSELSFEKKRNTIIFACSIATINVVLFFMKGLPFIVSYYPLLVQLPLFIGFYPLTKYQGVRLLFILLTTIISAAPIVQLPPVLAYFGVPHALAKAIARPLLCCLFTFLIYKWFAPLLRYVLEYQQKGWGMLCILPVTCYLIGTYVGKYDYAPEVFSSNFAARIGLTIITYAAYLVIFMFFKQSHEYLKVQNENKLLKIESEQVLYEIAALQAYQKQARTHRHDLRRHLNFLQNSITQNRLPQALTYIANVQRQLDQTQLKRYSLNDDVNLIVAAYIAKAEEKDIKSEVSITTTEFDRISTIDLCTLLANGLENAIAACQLCDENTPRFLKLRMYERNTKLCIEISNSYQTEPVFQDGLPLISEKEKGMGTKSMAYVVEKHAGVYQFLVRDGLFIFQAAL